MAGKPVLNKLVFSEPCFAIDEYPVRYRIVLLAQPDHVQTPKIKKAIPIVINDCFAIKGLVRLI